MRYLQIQVKGYKSLADITLDLHPLTVMIGPNGCGKTSLLEIFQLLREAAQDHLKDAIENLGSLTTILTHISGASNTLQIGFRVAGVSPERSDEQNYYHFVLRPRNSGYIVATERLEEVDADSSGGVYYGGENTGVELSHLSSYLWDSKAIPYRRDFPLAKSVLLNLLDVSPRAPVRNPQKLTPTTFPAPNGEGLFAALHNLRETKSSRAVYERIQETLNLAFPSFDHLELPVVGAGVITLTWHEKYLTVPLYPTDLSEGTLRFLWLTTVLLSPEPPPLILIDEPEVSLHPELLQILAALLRDASARTQLIVATHSSELIRWLRPDEVVVIDKQDGKSTFTWADDPALDLAKWLQEYTLADLWYMGNLGGRP